MLNSRHLILAGRYNVIPEDDKTKNLVYGIMYLNSERSVKNDYGITAGNFFAHKSVFQKVGYFPTQLKTGNDIIWSQKALQCKDVIIEYNSQLVVDYPGQSFKTLKKSIQKYALGIAHAEKEGGGRIKFLKRAFRYFLPMKISTFHEALRYRKLIDLPFVSQFRLWLYIWQIKIILGVHILRRV